MTWLPHCHHSQRVAHQRLPRQGLPLIVPLGLLNHLIACSVYCDVLCVAVPLLGRCACRSMPVAVCSPPARCGPRARMTCLHLQYRSACAQMAICVCSSSAGSMVLWFHRQGSVAQLCIHFPASSLFSRPHCHSHGSLMHHCACSIIHGIIPLAIAEGRCFSMPCIGECVFRQKRVFTANQ